MIIADVINSILAHEKKVANFYVALRDDSHNSSLRLLSYFLRRHCHSLSETLSKEDPAIVEILMNSEINKAPTTMLADPEYISMHHSELEADGLLKKILEHELLIKSIYTEIIDSCEKDVAVTLIKKILSVQNNKVNILQKMLATKFD
jgi:hypothetical protein